MSIAINMLQGCQESQKYGINRDRYKHLFERGIALIVSDPIYLTKAHTVHLLDSMGFSLSKSERFYFDLR